MALIFLPLIRSGGFTSGYWPLQSLEHKNDSDAGGLCATLAGAQNIVEIPSWTLRKLA
jgi:hypothetical protein